MKITAVIPNWNGRSRLPALLADLGNQTKPAAVLVIDNGSEDGSDDQAEASGATVVRFPLNQGFARAINAGVAHAQTELVAILNSDVRLRPDWVECLGVAMENTNAPFAVGKLLRLEDPEIMDGSFDAVCRGGCAWRCGSGRQAGAQWSKPSSVMIPPFTALLIQRRFFLELGGLDESFGSYLEDVDFGLRSAAAGYIGMYVPEAIAFHEGSGTLGKWNPQVVRQIARNQVLIVSKHYSTSLLLRWAWPIAVAHLGWGLIALKHGAGWPWLSGKIEGLRRFSSQRGTQNIEGVLRTSEKQLLDLQRSSGWDLYWRIYSLLT